MGSICRIITRYNNQHDEILKILDHHWPFLKLDPSLDKFITPQPQVTYRRVHTLRDRLVQSHFCDNPKKNHCRNRGTYPCGSCRYCNFLMSIAKQNNLVVNGVEIKLQHFANCNTQRVVYLLLCECGAFYVGLTKRYFWKRMYHQIHAIVTATVKSPIGYHTSTKHGHDPKIINFVVLDRVHDDFREGDLIQKLRQLET